MHFYSEVGRECLFCEAICEPGDPTPNSVSECLAGESEGRGLLVEVSGSEKNARGDRSCQNLADDPLFGTLLPEFETEKDAHHTQPDLKYGFVLRRLLDYPQAKCVEYFKRSEYSEGTGWFSVCKNCSELVKKGHSIHHRIEDLKRQLDKLKKILRDKIASGPLTEHEHEGRDAVPGNSKSVAIHLEVRKHIKIDNRKLSSNNVFHCPGIKFEIEGLDGVKGESNESDYLYDYDAISNSSSSAESDDDEDSEAAEVKQEQFGGQRIKDESYGTELEASPSVKRNLRRSLRPERPMTRYEESISSSSDDGGVDTNNSVETTGCRERRKSFLESDFVETIDTELESVPDEDHEPELDNPLHTSSNQSNQQGALKCQICCAVFITKHRLREHEELHKRETGVFKCKKCDFVCGSHEALRMHSNKGHGVEMKAVIFLKKLTLKNKTRLNPLNKTALGTADSYNCDKCPYVYKTIGKLKAHKKLHRRDDVLKCQLCGYVCEYERAMKVHVTKHHTRNANSDKHEPSIKKSRREYERPEISLEDIEQTQEESYNCDKCPYVYKTISKFKAHEKLHSRDDALKCQPCGYVCEYERAMKIHVTKHHPTNADSDKNEPATKKLRREHEKRDVRSEDMEVDVNHSEQECPTTTETSAKSEYRCKICKAVYQTHHRLKEHVQLHKDPSALKCPKCPFVCQSTRHFTAHGNKRHGDLTSHDNRQKRRILKQKQYLKKIACARVGGPFKCDHCPSIYVLRYGLRYHVRRYHPDKLLQCDNCEECFASKQFLDNHQLNGCKKNIGGAKDNKLGSGSGERKRPYACEQCPASFKKRRKYDKHIQMNHSRDKFPCSECKASFPTQNRLRYHKATQHADTHNVCTVCSYKANGSHHLRLHMQKHTKEKMAMCEICSKTFTTLVYLTAHKSKEHYEELGIQPLKCKDCNEIFSSKSVLKYHIQKVHEKKFNFFCETCGKGFLFASSLRNHSIVHQTERNLICQYCGASYARDKLLVKHMKSHHPQEYAISNGLDPSQIPTPNVSNDGPFTCKFCNEEFAFRWNLQNHLKSHTEIFKKYKCDTCGNGYSSQSGLKRHEETAHSGNIYPCTFCIKTFPCQDYLGHHARYFCSIKKKIVAKSESQRQDARYGELSRYLSHP